MMSSKKSKPFAARLAAFLAVACLWPTAGFVHATELLTNGDLEDPGLVGVPPAGWTLWTWGGGFANTEIPAWGSGSWQVSVGAPGNGGAGLYQIVPGAPDLEFTLTVSSGADAWWLPTGRMEMFFLNSTNGVITNATRLTVDPAVYGETNFDIAHPWSNYTLIATSPVGTAFIKVEFSCNESVTTPGYASGSVGFDNASLTAPIDPPVIADVYPNGLLMVTNRLSFTANSVVAIESSGIQVVLNGVDVSSSLVVTGSGTTNVSVSYSGLESNTLYNAVITVTDTANLSSLKNVSFDTYVPIFTWEAEDYNYDGGSYINDPTPSDVPAAGSYFGLSGIDGVDFHDWNNPPEAPHDYRASDAMATGAAGDASREKFLSAGASDYNVGYFSGANFGGNTVGIGTYDAGEWVNYTRSFPSGTYNIYGRLARAGGGTGTLPMSRVTSDPTLGDQTTEPLGVFRFPEQGWSAYSYAPLTDDFGNRIAVTLSGEETLRVSSVQDVNLNFFMLMPVDTEQPTITDVYPNGRTLLQGTNVLTFTVSSASHSIPQSNVVVTLNGLNVSGNLSFSGSTGSWNVSAPLELRVTNYTAVIDVADDVGNSHSVTLYFDTFDPASFVVEGEDFDFDGGQFIDNPVITSAAALNSYFDKESIHYVDTYEGDTVTPGDADFRYRQTDPIATSVCTDTPMQKTLDAQATNALAFNYNAAWWSSNGWLNFTRTYPTGDFNVYGRLAGGDEASYSISLDEVNGSTNHLGDFLGVGRGYNFFDWIPLVETNGQLAVVTLDGVTTLRATTAVGNVNPNNFLFTAALTPPTELQWSYAGGVLTLTWDSSASHLQAQTNAPGAGMTPNWSDYPGGGTSPVNVTVDESGGSLFFRLSE